MSKKNEIIVTTYYFENEVPTGYKAYQDILTKKFILYKGKEKIKTDDLPYFDDIVYGKSDNQEAPKRRGRPPKKGETK